MPRLRNALPKYRRHKRSGKGYISLNGEEFYFGPFQDPLSRKQADELIAEWLANERQIPGRDTSDDQFTVAKLILQFWRHVKEYYVKNGEPTSERHCFRSALRYVKDQYGLTPVRDFGPLALKAVREKMLERGLARSCINRYVHRVRRMFAWGVENELVPVEVHQALKCVAALKKGKTTAPETKPVMPVEDSVVELTLSHLLPVVADMVRFQRLTGSRPAEVCVLRPVDVDTSETIWTYRPESHKTEHHGRERIIFIGPKAQAILRLYLERAANTYCFSPQESEQHRRAENHAARKTPLGYGNTIGTSRKRAPRKTPGPRYTTNSYRRAVHRACDNAFPPPKNLSVQQRKEWRAEHQWSPNQLRHTAATQIRREFGIEAAQVALGHARADVTQVYAERDLRRGAEVAEKLG